MRTERLGLFCDLYELTMAAAYHDAGIERTATFELFIRRLPDHHGYLVAAGVEPLLDAIARFSFDGDDLDYLRSLGRFAEPFLERLGDLRFTGTLRGVPEGEVVFAGEPWLQVEAALIEAQLLETLVLNAVGFPTLVATKAARIASVIGDRTFVDFAARRVHGRQAADWAARAAVVGGAAGTSLVRAGRDHGLELSGTMAHSFVQSFDREVDAFVAYGRSQRRAPVLLVDTYDVARGVAAAIEAAGQLAAEGVEVAAVRIDSGDLAALAGATRAQLDEADLGSVRIIVSGDLDEYRVAELVASGAPIDGFGVGTRMGTAADAPALGVVYKLVADDTGPRMKSSPAKATLPGAKQVARGVNHDLVGLIDEPLPGRPLLVDLMRDGRPAAARATVAQASERRREAVNGLPAEVVALRDPAPWPVRVSDRLQELADTTGARR